MTEQDAPTEVSRSQQHHELTLAIYAAITLLGVLAAATWKGAYADEPEVIVIIVGTTVTVAVAHVWSTIVAHRITHRGPLNAQERAAELRNFLAFCCVGALAAGTMAISWALWLDLDASVRATSGSLIALLFVTGWWASRRSGGSWPLAAAWGILNASIGVAILIVKIVFG